MWEVIRGITHRKQDGKKRTTLPQMASAFIAGMVITAVLAYLPLITDILSHNLSEESAVPAPSEAPDSLKPDGSYEGNTPAKHFIYELVYAPFDEAILSG